VVILVVYRHPNLSKITPFLKSLNNIFSSSYFKNIKCELFCVGDFNIDWSRNSSTLVEYKSLIDKHDLLQLINSTTFCRNSHTSILDHVLINNNNILKSFQTRVFDYEISDHKLIEINFRSTKSNNNVNGYKRDFTKTNIDYFKEKVKNINWDHSVYTGSSSNIYGDFIKNIVDVYKQSFPIKLKKKSVGKSVWINEFIINLIMHKDYLYRHYKRIPTKTNYNKLLESRKLVRREIKLRKQIYYENCFSTKNQKDKWKILNKLMNKNKNSNTISQNFLMHDSFNICEMFANKFGNIVSQSPSEINNQLCHDENQILSINDSSILTYTNKDEIKKVFHSFKNKFTHSDNDIPMFLWKLISDVIANNLKVIFNNALSNGLFPNDLKKALITPLFKKGDKSDPNNYRPISILPNISKVFEKIILNRINNYVAINKCLPNTQFGFRQKCSTKDAILSMVLNIEKNLTSKYMCIILLDLSKAFDRVVHSTLLNKLAHIGFSKNDLSFLSSYLNNRCFFVNIDNTKSSPRSITNGVPQGSILGPLLYSLYVHDMGNKLNCQIIQYADDTSLLIPFNDINELQIKINNLYITLHDYLMQHNLLLNLDKTEIILHGWNKIESFTFGDSSITTKTHFKFLGINLDNMLRFDSHISFLIKRLNSMLPLIYNIRNNLPKHILKSFYYSFIYSLILYSTPFIISSSETKLKDLELVHKKVIKILFKFNKRFNTSDLYIKTDLLPIHKILYFQMYIIAHKIHYNTAPEEIIKHFKWSSISNNRLVFSYTYSTFSFNNYISKLWNSLPNYAKSIEEICEYKKKVKEIIVNGMP